MANQFNPSSLVSKTMVQSLHAKGNLINTVNTSYSKDFTQKKYVPGQTVEIDIMHQPTITKGRVATVQDIENRKTSVTIEQYNGAEELTSIEANYDIDTVDGWRKYADDIAMRLLREMEVTGFQHAQRTIGQAVGTPGTEPGALKTWSRARARTVNALAPYRKPFAAASPDAHVELTDSLKNAQNPITEISNQYLSGRMMEGAGNRFYESQSIPVHTAGTITSAAGAIAGAGQNGASLNVDGLTPAGGTVTAGTHFTVANVRAVDPENKRQLPYLKKFVVREDATAIAGAVTLVISPPIFVTGPHQNVSIALADNAVVTFEAINSQTSTANLVYDKDALSLVSVPLRAPYGEDKGKFMYSKYNGVNIRIGFGSWSATDDTQIVRVDAVWGWTTLREDHACIVYGA